MRKLELFILTMLLVCLTYLLIEMGARLSTVRGNVYQTVLSNAQRVPAMVIP